MRREAKTVRAGGRPLLAAVVAAALLTPMLRADEPLPKAEEILDRYVEATGGKAAYERLKSRRVTGTFSVPAQQLQAKLVVIEKAPNMSRLEIEIEGIGKSVRVCDGKHAWEINEALGGARLIQGDEAKEAVRNAVFNPDLHWRKLYKKVQTLSVEDVGGKPAYKVLLESEDGEKITNFYDKKTGRLVRSDRTIKTPMGDVTIQSFPADYKEFDGIFVATTTRQVVAQMNMERVFRIEKVEHNIDIPAEMFEPPASVKEQIAAAKQTKEAGKGKTEMGSTEPKPEGKDKP